MQHANKLNCATPFEYIVVQKSAIFCKKGTILAILEISKTYCTVLHILHSKVISSVEDVNLIKHFNHKSNSPISNWREEFLASSSWISHLENILLWILRSTYFESSMSSSNLNEERLEICSRCLFYAILYHSWMFSKKFVLVVLLEGQHEALYLT